MPYCKRLFCIINELFSFFKYATQIYFVKICEYPDKIRKKMTRTEILIIFLKFSLFSSSQYGNRTRVFAVRGRRLNPLTNWPFLFVNLLFPVDSFNIHHLFLKCKYFFKKISIFLFFSNFSFKKPCIYAVFATKKIFIFLSQRRNAMTVLPLSMAFPSYLFLFLTVFYSSISSAGSAGMNTRDFFSSCL